MHEQFKKISQFFIIQLKKSSFNNTLTLAYQFIIILLLEPDTVEETPEVIPEKPDLVEETPEIISEKPQSSEQESLFIY